MTIMNKKHQQALLHIINEEIEHFLFEQDPNLAPADPNAPPADPNAAPTGDAAGTAPETPEDPEEKAKKTVDDLSNYQDDVDIRKTIIDALEDGSKKEDMEDVLRYVEKYKKGTDPEKKIPANVLRVVFEEIVGKMGVKIPPPKPQKAPAPATAPSAQATAPAVPQPVVESRLQKLAREYLHYKKLYLRSK